MSKVSQPARKAAGFLVRDFGLQAPATPTHHTATAAIAANSSQATGYRGIALGIGSCYVIVSACLPARSNSPPLSFAELLTTMGVEIEVIKAGDGATHPQKGDMLTMHYTGTLAANGKQFDSSVAKGRPFQFVIGIGQVIRGWDEGVMKMSLGEKSVLRITSDYGYGAAGAGGVIPPNSDLNFEVELLAIGDTKAPGFTGGSDGGGCAIC